MPEDNGNAYDYDERPAGTMYYPQEAVAVQAYNYGEMEWDNDWMPVISNRYYEASDYDVFKDEYDYLSYDGEDYVYNDGYFGNSDLKTLSDVEDYAEEQNLWQDLKEEGQFSAMRHANPAEVSRPNPLKSLDNKLALDIRQAGKAYYDRMNDREHNSRWAPAYNEVTSELKTCDFSQRMALATELNALKSIVDGLEGAYKSRKEEQKSNASLLSIKGFLGGNEPNKERLNAIHRIQAVANSFDKVDLSVLSLQDHHMKISYDVSSLKEAVTTLKGAMLREQEGVFNTYWFRSADNSELHGLLADAGLQNMDEDDKLAGELAMRRFDKKVAEEAKDMDDKVSWQIPA
jgi:hypothetical protein